eukprot:68260-Chlamydomonas_euryale.AAC.1
MVPQGWRGKLSASCKQCTAWYLCFDRQLAMEQPSAQLPKAGPGLPCRWQAFWSTEADNTACALLPATASDCWRETVELGAFQ